MLALTSNPEAPAVPARPHRGRPDGGRHRAGRAGPAQRGRPAARVLRRGGRRDDRGPPTRTSPSTGPLLVPGIGAQGGTADDVRRIFGGVLDQVLPVELAGDPRRRPRRRQAAAGRPPGSRRVRARCVRRPDEAPRSGAGAGRAGPGVPAGGVRPGPDRRLLLGPERPPQGDGEHARREHGDGPARPPGDAARPREEVALRTSRTSGRPSSSAVDGLHRALDARPRQAVAVRRRQAPAGTRARRPARDHRRGGRS